MACLCGCGQTPPPAARTRAARGEVKGEPMRFMPGHGLARPGRSLKVSSPRSAKVDLSEFYKLSRPRRPPCAVGVVAVQLSEVEQAKLKAACGADPGIITASGIRDWLDARGHQVSVPAISNHRRKVCSCNE